MRSSSSSSSSSNLVTLCFAFLSMSMILEPSCAWVMPSSLSRRQGLHSTISLGASSSSYENENFEREPTTTTTAAAATTINSRRSFGTQILATTAALLTTNTVNVNGAFAAASSYDEDKAKIVKGYKRLGYLLENWDKETTFCGTQIDPFSGKVVCEKTPLVVQEYMGYKSINDPLFKADKTLLRLEALVPPDLLDKYLDCVETWATTADEASGMAYTSSWAGPQNPNGGDDSIAYFLDRAKAQVITARGVLGKVMDILELKE